MINRRFDSMKILFRKGAASATAALLFFTSAVVPAAQGGFWEDRHRNAGGQAPSGGERASLSQALPLGEKVLNGYAPVSSDAAPLLPLRSASKKTMPSWMAGLVTPFAEVEDFNILPGGSSSRPFILLVQDVHDNVEAQGNLSKLLSALDSRYDVRLIGLEGAEGPFKQGLFRRSAPAADAAFAADFLLEHRLIGGAEHFALTAPREPFLWGVENETSYLANVEAYRRTVPLQAAVKEYEGRLASVLAEVKLKVFSPELAALDRKGGAYAAGTLGLGEYLEALSSAAGTRKDLFPETASFLKAYALEKSIDFKQADAERARLVEALTRSLSPAELENLVALSLDYRAGRLSFGDYYGRLKDLSLRHGVDLGRTPALKAYIEYALAADRVRRDALFIETAALEKEAGDRLAVTNEQKEALSLSRDARLLEKLFHQQMTPEEWALWQERRGPAARLNDRLSALGLGLPPLAFPADPSLFEAFYVNAFARNGDLLSNFMMKTKDAAPARAGLPPAVVLVTGGFHTAGLRNLLSSKGASFAVLTPRLTKVDPSDDYLNVFSRGRTPLEQLMLGRAVFLESQRPLALRAARGFEDAGKTVDGLWQIIQFSLRVASGYVSRGARISRGEASALAAGYAPFGRFAVQDVDGDRVTLESPDGARIDEEFVRGAEPDPSAPLPLKTPSGVGVSIRFSARGSLSKALSGFRRLAPWTARGLSFFFSRRALKPLSSFAEALAGLFRGKISGFTGPSLGWKGEGDVTLSSGGSKTPHAWGSNKGLWDLLEADYGSALLGDTPRERQVKLMSMIHRKQIDITDEGVVVIPVAGLGRLFGEPAYIGLGQSYSLPVVYIDRSYFESFQDRDNYKRTLSHELSEIRKWEELRGKLELTDEDFQHYRDLLRADLKEGFITDDDHDERLMENERVERLWKSGGKRGEVFPSEMMRSFIRYYFHRPIGRKIVIDGKGIEGATTKELAEQWHKDAPNIDDLVAQWKSASLSRGWAQMLRDAAGKKGLAQANVKALVEAMERINPVYIRTMDRREVVSYFRNAVGRKDISGALSDQELLKIHRDFLLQVGVHIFNEKSTVLEESGFVKLSGQGWFVDTFASWVLRRWNDIPNPRLPKTFERLTNTSFGGTAHIQEADVTLAAGGEGPPALTENLDAGVIADEGQLEMLRMLLLLGQGHLFEKWDPPGKNDDRKRAFLAQIAKLDAYYPGGLRSYRGKAAELLQAARAGKSPMDGYAVSPPEVEDLTKQDERFRRLEQEGLKEANKLAWVLVAGGKGQRLDYDGIKLDMLTDLASGTTYGQWFISGILALQEKSNRLNGEHRPAALAVMTSEDNHQMTIDSLRKYAQGMSVEEDDGAGNKRVLIEGSGKGTITLMKQGAVPAVFNHDGDFGLDAKDPYKLATLPHGHSDIHALLYHAKLNERWEKEGRSHLVFFQDTSTQIFSFILAQIGYSVEQDLHFNFGAVSRVPKENTGLLSKVLSPGGRGMVRNVEYAVAGKADVADPATGLSPFPGNMNIFIVKRGPYDSVLKETGGGLLDYEIINADPAKMAGGTRLEGNMQDESNYFDPEKVRVSVFDKEDSYTPAKNSISKAAKAQSEGKPAEAAATSEAYFHKHWRRVMAAAGVLIGVQGAPRTAEGVSFEEGARVVLGRSFASTWDEALSKIKGGRVTDRSTLIVEGDGVTLDGLDLDGTLVIDVAPGVRLRVEGLKVSNQGDVLELVPPSSTDDPNLKVRGFRLVSREQTVIKIDKPGDYVVRSLDSQGRPVLETGLQRDVSGAGEIARASPERLGSILAALMPAGIAPEAGIAALAPLALPTALAAESMRPVLKAAEAAVEPSAAGALELAPVEGVTIDEAARMAELIPLDQGPFLPLYRAPAGEWLDEDVALRRDALSWYFFLRGVSVPSVEELSAKERDLLEKNDVSFETARSLRALFSKFRLKAESSDAKVRAEAGENFGAHVAQVLEVAAREAADRKLPLSALQSLIGTLLMDRERYAPENSGKIHQEAALTLFKAASASSAGKPVPLGEGPLRPPSFEKDASAGLPIVNVQEVGPELKDPAAFQNFVRVVADSASRNEVIFFTISGVTEEEAKDFLSRAKEDASKLLAARGGLGEEKLRGRESLADMRGRLVTPEKYKEVRLLTPLGLYSAGAFYGLLPDLYPALRGVSYDVVFADTEKDLSRWDRSTLPASLKDRVVFLLIDLFKGEVRSLSPYEEKELQADHILDYQA